MDVFQQQRNDAPARMAPLAKLPVFWGLEGKRVVVAGGSDAAAWKAELLAACGAEVHVYAEDLTETFGQLVGRGSEHPQGRFVHHPRMWSAEVLNGATLAVAGGRGGSASRRKGGGVQMMAAMLLGFGAALDPPQRHVAEAKDETPKGSPETGEPELDN